MSNKGKRKRMFVRVEKPKEEILGDQSNGISCLARNDTCHRRSVQMITNRLSKARRRR